MKVVVALRHSGVALETIELTDFLVRRLSHVTNCSAKEVRRNLESGKVVESGLIQYYLAKED
jgi:hypothetical protein